MDPAGVMSSPGRARPGRIQVWLQASRAFTLGMPFMSVTVGSFLAFYAGASLSLPKYLAAAAAAMLLQAAARSEEHTSELQSPDHLVCRLLLEKKKKQINKYVYYRIVLEDAFICNTCPHS